MLATLIKKGTGDAASQMPARSVTFGTRYAAYRMPGRVFGGDKVCVQRFKIFKSLPCKKASLLVKSDWTIRFAIL